MNEPSREEYARQIEQDAEAFRAERQATIRDFASGIEKDRAMFAQAERSGGGEVTDRMKCVRARVAEAERTFYEQMDRALLSFEAAAERARRLVG